MPVEIREIIIKATVTEGEKSAGASSNAAPPGGTPPASSLQDAVEQVMQMLEDKKQR